MTEIKIISHSIGYMLKVLKNNEKLPYYNSEFKSIRHGDYINFIIDMNGTIPDMVIYNNGVITVPTSVDEIKNECDFAKMIGAAPSLKKFYDECYKAYGEIKDNDITDDIYHKIAYFEIGLRMRANNLGLIKNGDTLHDVIDSLIKQSVITINDGLKLHDGKRFINMVKHHHKNKQKNKKNPYINWVEGLKAFEEAYSVLIKNDLIL